MKTKRPYDEIAPIAKELVDLLFPLCRRIVVAGSLRRLRPEIGDIEIVAEPKEYVPDLLGNPTETHSLDTFDWSVIGVLVKGGHKYKQVELKQGISLDLFIVTPPAQWGVVLLLRTGNDNFSRTLVTKKVYGGMMPVAYKMKDGALWHGGELVPTPEERDVFKVLGIKYIPPVERQF